VENIKIQQIETDVAIEQSELDKDEIELETALANNRITQIGFDESQVTLDGQEIQIKTADYAP